MSAVRSRGHLRWCRDGLNRWAWRLPRRRSPEPASSRPHQVPDQTLVPEATVGYAAGDATSLARALMTAKARNPARICEQARQRFDFADVVARTRAAIEL